MKTLYHSFLFCFSLLICFEAKAQEDLMNILDADSANTQSKDFTYATFKGTRIINGHSVELRAKEVLQFIISHRFGTLNSGAYEFFGLDQSTIRLGLDYGITDRITIGIGRNSFEKTYDGFAKFKVLRQSNTMPLSAVLFGSFAINGLKFPDQAKQEYFKGRLTYTYQLLLARKFSESFSFQIAPSLVHRNLVNTEADDNDVISLGFAGRYKLTKRIAIVTEYYYNISEQTSKDFINSLAVGFDIETGGHVFQLHFTNSRGMIEKFFIPQTTGRWSKGDIHFGFNISRAFNLSKK